MINISSAFTTYAEHRPAVATSSYYYNNLSSMTPQPISTSHDDKPYRVGVQQQQLPSHYVVTPFCRSSSLSSDAAAADSSTCIDEYSFGLYSPPPPPARRHMMTMMSDSSPQDHCDDENHRGSSSPLPMFPSLSEMDVSRWRCGDNHHHQRQTSPLPSFKLKPKFAMKTNVGGTLPLLR